MSCMTEQHTSKNMDRKLKQDTHETQIKCTAVQARAMVIVDDLSMVGMMKDDLVQ